MGIEEQFILLSIGLCMIVGRIAIRWRVAGPSNWQIDDYLMPLTGVSFLSVKTDTSFYLTEQFVILMRSSSFSLQKLWERTWLAQNSVASQTVNVTCHPRKERPLTPSRASITTVYGAPRFRSSAGRCMPASYGV